MATPADPRITESPDLGRPESGWRRRLYVVIFEADTRAGQAFDLALIALILASVAVVMLDSVAEVRSRHGVLLDALEWTFTILFSIEYLARLACVRRPLRYARSVFGVIDLLAVLPTYLAVLVPGLEALIDVRVLRLLRIFRVLKLGAYVAEFGALGQALAASRRKIFVFLGFVLLVVLVMGTLMYVIEGPANGFTSIPVAVYWAITTMTTVGFGDITPRTDLGRLIASAMMLVGWGTLAVPTGIVSAEFMAQKLPRETTTTRTCPECLSEGHLPTARFCRDCGTSLPPWQSDLVRFTDTPAALRRTMNLGAQAAAKERTMTDATAEVTTEVLQAFADAWNRHDVDALMSFMTEDCVFIASAGPDVCGARYAGREAVRAAYSDVWATFPDAHWGNARHLVSGERGVSEWTFAGTRSDGARVEVHGCDLFTFRDGKIAVKDSYRKNRPVPGSTRP